MPTSTKSQIVASIVIFLGVAFIWAFGPPFFVTVIFLILCFMWAGWIFISIFQGTDELNSASIRFALAAASGVGVPLSLAFVMLMIAMPDIQRVITSFAALSPLSPAAAGFGIGVTFTVLVLCVVLVISQSVWWATKR